MEVSQIQGSEKICVVSAGETISKVAQADEEALRSAAASAHLSMQPYNSDYYMPPLRRHMEYLINIRLEHSIGMPITTLTQALGRIYIHVHMLATRSQGCPRPVDSQTVRAFQHSTVGSSSIILHSHII